MIHLSYFDPFSLLPPKTGDGVKEARSDRVVFSGIGERAFCDGRLTVRGASPPEHLAKSGLDGGARNVGTASASRHELHFVRRIGNRDAEVLIQEHE